MSNTLRELLLRQAARLQGWPALSAPAWGTLSYAQLRNKVEGVAFGLLAEAPPERISCATGSAWDWVAELAVAASGLRWDPAAPAVDPGFLGGARFNLDAGRGVYHQRESQVTSETPFTGTLAQGELLRRLARLNVHLGWDHETVVELPLSTLDQPGTRGILWSCLFAGAHARLGAASADRTLADHLRIHEGLWLG